MSFGEKVKEKFSIFRCAGLVLLETYTTKTEDLELPDFLDIQKEVTSEPEYSMFNLSRKDNLVSKSLGSPTKVVGTPSNGHTNGDVKNPTTQTNGNGDIDH